jgi:large subunit ribosomal protein L18
MVLKKELRRTKRLGSIRRKITGTPDRPRLCVRRSLKQFYAQLVDDTRSMTLFGASTIDKGFSRPDKRLKKIELSAEFGKYFAERLKQKSVVKIAFDRAGYKYHGRIKAFAEALRENGIQF